MHASALVTLLLAIGLPACQKAPAPPTLEVGRPVLERNPVETRELTLAAADRARAERWVARFTRTDRTWVVASAPGGSELPDRRAASAFLEHLLETLRTLNWAQLAPRGDAESYGLAPPRFSLTLRSDAGTPESFDVGDSLPLPDGSRVAYVRLNREAGPLIGLARGAAFEMLERIGSFTDLRERRLLDGKAETVEKAEAFVRGRRVGLAKSSLIRRLDAIHHLRASAFEDDAARAAKLRVELAARPDYLWRLHSRGGPVAELRVMRSEGALWAVFSGRPDAVARLDDSAIQHLEPREIR